MTDTERIKEAMDIVGFIGEYVPLKSSGIHHKGRCPFHSEKSPSFMVSRERNSWHCFGCNKGGDIFSFVQEIEGMEFVEALTFLANRAGIELTGKRATGEGGTQKNRLKEIMTDASKFYHHILVNMSAAKAARDYVATRGVSDQSIVDWRIGFVPDQWDLLTKYLLKKGHAIDDLVAAGLTIKRDNANPQNYKGFYDRFRGRIMFPINDVHGYTVGFTGRVLVETEKSGGKYVNTPQTLLYDKSLVVFGLDKAKKVIKEKNVAVIVEGQMDVIACHQAGMKNVVASSGTALTEQQVGLLKRYSDNMAMAFDMDAAGQRAAKRGIDIAIEQGCSVRVIRIPDGKGKDADECIQKNKEVWFASVENAQDIMQWYLDKALSKVTNIHDPKQKQLLANELLPDIARIPFAVEQDHWLQRVAQLLQVEVAVLREDMKRYPVKPAPQTAPQQPETPQPKAAVTAVKKPVALSRKEQLQERLYMLLLRFTDLPQIDTFFSYHKALEQGAYSALYEYIKSRYTLGSASSAFVGDMPLSLEVLLLKADAEFGHLMQDQASIEAKGLLEAIYNEWKKERRQFLEREIQQAEQQGNSAQLAALLQEVQQL